MQVQENTFKTYLENEQFNISDDNIDINKVFIARQRFGLINGKQYTEKQIAEFLLCSEEYIYECIRDVIVYCNNKNDHMFDEYLSLYEEGLKITKNKSFN